MKKIITFLTDFGTATGYAAQMKGIVLGLTDAQCVDITHNVSSHNIREGAFLLQTVVPYYPKGTVHVAVVDPGVGTQRKPLVITTKAQILVGPDNGLLIPAARFIGDFTVYEIVNKKYFLHPVSNTFHGRDVFAPVAASIVNGIAFDEIGNKTTEWVDLDFGQAEITQKSAQGKVLYIDGFGNIITNIPGYRLKEFLSFHKNVMLFLGGQSQMIPYVPSYGCVEEGTPLLTIGSSNYLEISTYKGNAAKNFAIQQDDEIKLLFG